jgi:hypothetical protein
VCQLDQALTQLHFGELKAAALMQKTGAAVCAAE